MVLEVSGTVLRGHFGLLGLHFIWKKSVRGDIKTFENNLFFPTSNYIKSTELSTNDGNATRKTILCQTIKRNECLQMNSTHL